MTIGVCIHSVSEKQNLKMSVMRINEDKRLTFFNYFEGLFLKKKSLSSFDILFLWTRGHHFVLWRCQSPEWQKKANQSKLRSWPRTHVRPQSFFDNSILGQTVVIATRGIYDNVFGLRAQGKKKNWKKMKYEIYCQKLHYLLWKNLYVSCPSLYVYVKTLHD